MNDNSQQGMSRVFLAAPLDINSLESDCFTTREKISWTAKEGGIIAQKNVALDNLSLALRRSQIAITKVSFVPFVTRLKGWYERVKLERRGAIVATSHSLSERMAP